MLNVLIYDEDSNYISKLIQQLTQIKTPHYTFVACSNQASFERTLHSGESFQVILVGDTKGNIGVQIAHIKQKIMLVERLNPNNTSEMMKYQSVRGFLYDLDSLLEIGSCAQSKENPLSQNIALVLSAEGGSGKTTCAVALAKLYSKDFKTLLLTFETQSDLGLRLGLKEIPAMADLFYFVKRTDSSRLKGFQKLFEQDGYLGFSVFTPFKTIQDVQAITTEDVVALLTLIKEQCDFEKIVIDSTGRLDEINLTFLQETSTLWMITGSSVYSEWRQGQMLMDISTHMEKNNLTPRFTLHRLINDHSNNQALKNCDQSIVQLPYDAMIQDSYRAQIYALLTKPYYKALKMCIDGNIS